MVVPAKLELALERMGVDSDAAAATTASAAASQYIEDFCTAVEDEKEEDEDEESAHEASEEKPVSEEKTLVLVEKEHHESAATLDWRGMASWCRSKGLGDSVLQRLQDERFLSPEHLVHLDKKDLDQLVDGLRLGEKAGFFHAVHELRQVRKAAEAWCQSWG